jgi:hypothetical protein
MTLGVPVRRILGGVAATVLALTAVPALAEGTDVPVEPEVLAACAPVAGAEVLTVEGFAGTIATPSAFVGNEREDAFFVLDLAGLPVGTTGSVNATMTWPIVANDYDLEVLAGRAGGISENFQPFDPAEENVFAAGLAHCQKVTVTAIDFLAPAPLDTLDLDLVVTTKAPV